MAATSLGSILRDTLDRDKRPSHRLARQLVGQWDFIMGEDLAFGTRFLKLVRGQNGGWRLFVRVLGEDALTLSYATPEIKNRARKFGIELEDIRMIQFMKERT